MVGFFKILLNKSPGKFKVRISTSKKQCFSCFNEAPLKMMKNVCYFILKLLFVLRIFTFLFLNFGQV